MSRRDERGMTLLEAVVALTIIALAGIAALATVGTELRGAERARRAIEAAALAEERMARVGLLAAPDLASLPDSMRAGTFPGRLADYGWTAASRSLPGERDTYAVTVAVTWPERGRYALETRWYRPRVEERVR
jgi:type II secretion system protein I